MQILTAPCLFAPGIAAHGFFTRHGGVSERIYASLNCGPGSGDRPQAVAENRRRALHALCTADAAALVTAYQCHSAVAVEVTEPWTQDNAPRADAMVTNRPGIALGILTADCAPVLLLDAEAGVVAAAHAGWRGALTGIVESAVSLMERIGAKRHRIGAAVGPCIGQANYEVGAEFRQAFLDADASFAAFFNAGRDDAHWQFDLPAFVCWRLAEAGIGDPFVVPRCTYDSSADFFSYRRTTHRRESDYGRQLSAIMLPA